MCNNIKIGLLYLVFVQFLFSCGSDDDNIEPISIDVVSPADGMVYGKGETFDIKIDIKSTTPLKKYTYEIANYRWPGYYQERSGKLSGTTGTIFGKFTYSTTTRKGFGLIVTIEDINGLEVTKRTGFVYQGY